MTEDIHVNPRDCMNLVVTLLKLGGFWDINSSSAIKTNAYKLYKIFVHYCLFFSSFTVLMKVIVDRNHFDEIIECIILLIAYIVFIPKYCTILMKSTEIRNLVSLVPENFFIHTDHLTTENKSIIMSTLKYAKCLTLFYTSLITTCFIFNIDIVPFVLNYKAIRESSNTTSEALRVLQFNIWLPYDYFPSPAFQLTYFFLTIKYHIVGFSILSADILILNLLIYASGQFELLCYALKNFEENVIYRVRKKN